MFSTIINTITRKLTPAQLQPLSITDVYPCLIGQRERNEARMEQIKTAMGEKYILHPKYKVKRLKKARPL